MNERTIDARTAKAEDLLREIADDNINPARYVVLGCWDDQDQRVAIKIPAHVYRKLCEFAMPGIEESHKHIKP